MSKIFFSSRAILKINRIDFQQNVRLLVGFVGLVGYLVGRYVSTS